MSFHPFPILASCVEFQRLRWPSGRVLFSTIQSDSIPFEDPHTQNLTYKRDHKIRCKDWCMCHQPFLFQLWQAFHEWLRIICSQPKWTTQSFHWSFDANCTQKKPKTGWKPAVTICKVNLVYYRKCLIHKSFCQELCQPPFEWHN